MAMTLGDYQSREYLSVGEVANFLGAGVKEIHARVKRGELPAFKSASGQYRFRLGEIKNATGIGGKNGEASANGEFRLSVSSTAQRIIVGDSRRMNKIKNDSIHLAITSPPYFNAKMYSDAADNLAGDLGNIHDLDEWLKKTGEVWAEIYRALQPGRKFFLNIMNLPVRANGSFRSLNLVGKSADLCESLGFVFKRDIVWHKTNGVRAHFGTFPYPGGILLNNMHEFILEFNKPAAKSGGKYAHVTAEQKERSKLDKEFWLSLKNSDVWLMKPEKSGGNRSHPSPFPMELPLRLIRAFSFEGETVCDPFLGSGTTLLAAAQCGRNGVGYEINGQFCESAANRLRRSLI